MKSKKREEKVKTYDPKKIEKKWQNFWLEKKTFFANEKSKGKKKMVLIEFPYPSGAGLHMGHMRPFIAGDVTSKYFKLNGFNTMYPIGWDAFGLPAENYAIKNKVHPSVSTKKNISNAKKQLQSWGTGFDWGREIDTTDPEYYKWTQKIFLEFFKTGLAYEKFGEINWCPKDKTGLANEEVVDGKCERCGTEVQKKNLRQWYLKITDYAEKLLEGLKKLPEWPEPVKIQQENWIGKSEASEIDFKIYSEKESRELDTLKIVTTRPDTLYGASFIAIAPEHSLIEKHHVHISNYLEVSKYTGDAKKMEGFERGRLGREKTGVLLAGIYALHPFTKKQLPVYSADFVIPGYGTGAIMGVPAHDQRDFDFAKKFNLPIINVIEKPKQGAYYFNLYDSDNSDLAHQMRSISAQEEYITQSIVSFSLETTKKQTLVEILKKNLVGDNKDFSLIEKGETFTLEPKNKLVFSDVYSGDGKHINSDFLNNLYTTDAIKQANTKLVDRKIGGPAVHYKLKDWVFSRQRYWGEPIPLVHCPKCGIVPVPEKDLPVKLPNVKNYEPTGTGESPLATIDKWVNTKCPNCKGKAKRETNTMPQWAGSSWYYLRYMDPKNKKSFADLKKQKYWSPVDLYFGGMEHTTLHLLYSRFWNLMLKDKKLVSVSEPYKKRVPHGIILGPDGEKMSKSRGNVVNPDELVTIYGADTVRLYMMFLGPHGSQVSWNDKGIVGARRFIERVFSLQNIVSKKEPIEVTTSLHKTIKKVGEDIETFSFNTAVSAMMIFVNTVLEHKSITEKSLLAFVKILAPFCPHVCEELWQNLKQKGSVFASKWPKFDAKLFISVRMVLAIQVNGKVRDTIEIHSEASEKEIVDMAKNTVKVKPYLENKEIKKIIVIKDKIVSIVTN